MLLRSLWDEKLESESSFSISINQIRNNAYKLSFSTYRQRQNNHSKVWIPLGGPNGLCKIIIGGTPTKNISRYWSTNENGHTWVTISDMKQRYIKTSKRTITDAGITESNVRNKEVPKGTILLSFKLTIGKVAIAGCNLFTNEAIAGFIPKDNRILSEYLYHLLPTINLQNYAQPAAKGLTLNKRILENIRIPVPSIDCQRMFIKEMNELEAEIIRLHEEAKILGRKILETSEIFIAKYSS